MCKREYEIYCGDNIEAVDYAYWKKRDDSNLFLIERIIPSISGLPAYMMIYECGDRLHPIYSTQEPAPNWPMAERVCLEYLVKLFYPEALSK